MKINLVSEVREVCPPRTDINLIESRSPINPLFIEPLKFYCNKIHKYLRKIFTSEIICMIFILLLQIRLE